MNPLPETDYNPMFAESKIPGIGVIFYDIHLRIVNRQLDKINA